MYCFLTDLVAIPCNNCFLMWVVKMNMKNASGYILLLILNFFVLDAGERPALILSLDGIEDPVHSFAISLEGVKKSSVLSGMLDMPFNAEDSGAPPVIKIESNDFLDSKTLALIVRYLEGDINFYELPSKVLSDWESIRLLRAANYFAIQGLLDLLSAYMANNIFKFIALEDIPVELQNGGTEVQQGLRAHPAWLTLPEELQYVIALRLWSFQHMISFQPTMTELGQGLECSCVEFNRDGSLLAFGFKDRIRLHRINEFAGYLDSTLSQRSHIVRFSEHKVITSFKWRNNSNNFVIGFEGGQTGAIREYQVSDQLVCTILSSRRSLPVLALSLSFLGQEVGAGFAVGFFSRNSGACVYTSIAGNLRGTRVGLKGVLGSVLSVSFHPTKQLLAVGGAFDIPGIWGIDGSLYAKLPKQSAITRSIVFSPDGRFIAIAAGQNMHIYDLEREQECVFTGKHLRDITSLAFAADGSILASGSIDGLVKIWDMCSGRCLASFNASESGELEPINALAFSPTNRMLAIGFENGRSALIGTRPSRRFIREHMAEVFVNALKSYSIHR